MKHYLALVDCDCFFVSAERAFNPKLEGLAVAVLSNNDGCVISRSKEAKALGVKMGEPYFMARQKFPDILYVRANHELYQTTSQKVMDMLKTFTPEIEVCSIDEAYLDLTGTKLLYKQDYIKTAYMIRKEVFNKLHIPVSIGLSTTKTLAKLASDIAKTGGGVFAIGGAKRRKVLAGTPIEDVVGVGKKILVQMRENCIFTALDFISRPDYWIKAKFGVHGMDLKSELSGRSLFKVECVGKAPLSIQQTASLKEFSRNLEVLKVALLEHIHTACRKARKENLKAGQIEVMLKTKDFQVVSKKMKLDCPSNLETEIISPALTLLSQIYSPLVTYRSTGITLSLLGSYRDLQLDLFKKAKSGDDRLGKALDELEEKFGKNIVHLG